MALLTTKAVENTFLLQQVPRLTNQYSLFFSREDTCMEYFLCNRHTGEQISKALIVSHEVFSNSLYVSRFYPELYKQVSCKYLSAACFYLMVHHAAGVFHLLDRCRVNLETDKDVFLKFYARLQDFHFYIRYERPAQKVYLTGHYRETALFDDLVHPNV